MPFVLRQPGDETNPTLALPYGEKHLSTGLLTWYEKQGNRTKFISLLSTGQLGGMYEVRYGGQTLAEFDSLGNRQWRFHDGRQSNGFDDAEQGRPLFFPNLDFAFSNKSYVEVLLPPELSEDEEPNRAQFIVKGLLINRYDAAGAVVDRGAYGLPSLMSADIWLARYGAAPARLDFGSLAAFTEECEELIEWATGAGLKAEYFATTAFGDKRAERIEPLVDFDYTGSAPAPGIPATNYSIRYTGTLIPTFTGPHTFYLAVDDSAVVRVDGAVVVERAAHGEAQGVVALNAGQQYAISVEYVALGATNKLTLEWASASHARQLVPTTALRAGSLFLPRYRCGVGFPTAINAMDAHRAVLAFAPGAGWQDTDGKLRYFASLARPRAATLNGLTAAGEPLTLLSLNFGRKRPESKYNFFRIFFRDEFDALLRKRHVEVDRPALRESVGGHLNELVVPSIGVCSQSLAERYAESLARRLTDLDLFAKASTFFQTGYRASKDDLVAIAADDLAGTSLAEPKEFIVRGATFVPPGDSVEFELQEFGELYSDTSHGEINPTRAGGDVPSRFAAPPVVQAVAPLGEGLRRQPDGTFKSTIEGVVQTGAWAYRQLVRVWSKYEGEAEFSPTDKLLEPDLSTGRAPFLIESPPLGDHELKFVTESRAFGVRLPFEAHAAYPVSVTVDLVPAPPAPVNITLRRAVSGAWYIAWDAGANADALVGQGEEVRQYTLRIVDLVTGEVKRSVPLIKTGSRQFIAWEPFAVEGAVCGVGASFNSEGGLSYAGSLTDNCYYRSQPIHGDSRLRFQLGTALPPVLIALGGEDGPGALAWRTSYSGGVAGFNRPKENILGGPSPGFRLLPRSVWGINVEQGIGSLIDSREGLAYTNEKHTNYVDYRYVVRVGVGGFIGGIGGHAQELLNAYVEPVEPESFVYTSAMQVEDFGAEQEHVRVQVAQVSLNPIIGQGEWATADA